MKPLVVLLGASIVGGSLYFITIFGATVEVDKPKVEEVQEQVILEAVDVLDVAQEALDKANALLDEEETRLLEERAVIDQRLEIIIKKRTSF